jgi:acyl-CoA synthetase (AMP-forming)/AMP-acid ligase II
VTKEKLDYDQVKTAATHLSTALEDHHNLSAGDTVTLFASNTIWYPVALWATLRAGGRINGASPAYSVEEMAAALRTAETKFVFTQPEALPRVVAAAQDVGIPAARVFLLEGEVDGYGNVAGLVERGARRGTAREPYRVPVGKTNRDVCAYLNFSSGTTGLPKAVMLSCHNVIAQCHQLRQLQVVEAGERYRVLAQTPLFHITGLVRYIHYPILMNGCSIMLPAFDMETMLRTIISYQIRELILVPPIIIRIVRDPIVARYLDDLRRTVKRWSSGSAPTPPEIIQLLHRKFPATGFRQGYGATESTACISCHPPTHYDYKYAMTAGKLCANTVAKVIDLDDPTKELGVNETGEICARGPQIAMGYLNNPKATRETFDRDGFLHTGDVGHIDSEGFLHIEDRIKEMIKVRGQQVAPAELEDALQGHEAVEDCAVLGVADEYSGEKPKAYVVLREGVAASAEVGMQLLQHVQGRKSRYKWLVEVEFIDAIPKSPTGKVLRRVLKATDGGAASRVKGLCVRDVGMSRAKM